MKTLICDEQPDRPEPSLRDSLLDLMLNQPLLVVALIEILTD